MVPSLSTGQTNTEWQYALVGILLRLAFLGLGMVVALPIAVPSFSPSARTFSIVTAWLLLIPSTALLLVITSLTCLATLQSALTAAWLLYPAYLVLPASLALRTLAFRGSAAPSLLRPSFTDGFVYARIFRGYFPPGVQRLAYLESSDPATVISRLEPILVTEPGNWHVRYLIGDWYMRAKRYVDALQALHQAYRLRQKDPRSTYALATAYRVLARASLEGTDIRAAMTPYLARLRTTNPELHRQLLIGAADFDPNASADELERIGLTVDEVASRALEYFELTIALGTRPEETLIVDQSLQSMYSEFPHLEATVKARRKTDTGLFGPARKGSAALWNEARDHYARLRHLFNEPGRYRFELGEVIRLCQWVIAADKKDGDAFVLLANAYSLLDTQVAHASVEPHKYLRWSGSLLQHWLDTPLCQYPFTNSREIGQRLYANVLETLIRIDKVSPEQLVAGIRRRCQEDLPLALSPATFAEIKEQLQSEPL
jgi:tetratricopeptide (TPR) repeat protein